MHCAASHLLAVAQWHRGCIQRHPLDAYVPAWPFSQHTSTVGVYNDVSIPYGINFALLRLLILLDDNLDGNSYICMTFFLSKFVAVQRDSKEISKPKNVNHLMT